MVTKVIKWATKEGQVLNINEMETSHIQNCLNMLYKKRGKILELIGQLWDLQDEHYSGVVTDILKSSFDKAKDELRRTKGYVIAFQKELKRRTKVKDTIIDDDIEDYLG